MSESGKCCANGHVTFDTKMVARSANFFLISIKFFCYEQSVFVWKKQKTKNKKWHLNKRYLEIGLSLFPKVTWKVFKFQHSNKNRNGQEKTALTVIKIRLRSYLYYLAFFCQFSSTINVEKHCHDGNHW